MADKIEIVRLDAEGNVKETLHDDFPAGWSAARTEFGKLRHGEHGTAAIGGGVDFVKRLGAGRTFGRVEGRQDGIAEGLGLLAFLGLLPLVPAGAADQQNHGEYGDPAVAAHVTVKPVAADLFRYFVDETVAIAHLPPWP